MINDIIKELQNDPNIDDEFKNIMKEYEIQDRIKDYMWRKACEMYSEKNLLDANGDIFYILEKEEGFYNIIYVAKRVLWNFHLSNERYNVVLVRMADNEGNYEYTDYNVQVIFDKE